MTVITKTCLPIDAGKRLDLALTHLFPHYSRTQLTTALKKGFILVNHQHRLPKTKVNGSELISFDMTELPHTSTTEIIPEPIPLNIHYEDEQLLIINKPASLTVHPGAGQLTHTLVHGLLFYDKTLENLPRAGLIHRLDKNTTGLLLVAKTPISYHALSEQMRHRTIIRHYLGLVEGKLTLPGSLTTALGRHPQHRTKMAVRRCGKIATTLYRPIKIFYSPLSHRHYTLLHIELKTGRTHQIRVHMAHLKHPLVGDPVYNPSNTLDFNRQALHAYQLCFTHPYTQQSMLHEVALPPDCQSLLNQLQSMPHD